MGKKAGRRERRATMTEEERTSRFSERAERSPEDMAAFQEKRRARGLAVEDEPADTESWEPEARSSGHTLEMANLRTLTKEERELVRQDIITESATARLSAFVIFRKLSRFALPQWRAVSFGFLLLLLQSFMDLAKPLPLAYSIDTVVKQDTLAGAGMNALFIAGGIVVAIAFFEGLFSYLRVLVVNRAMRTMTRNIRATMFDHVQRLSLQYHSRKRTGDLMMRISGDIRSIQTIFTDTFIEILNNSIWLVGMAALLLYLDLEIGALAIGLAIPLFFYIKKYSVLVRTYTSAQRRREGQLSSLFHDALGSTRLTRVFNRETQVRNKFEEESAVSLELGLLASLRDSRFGWSVDVFGALITAVVFIFATYKAQQGLISEGELFLFFYYARSFYRPIRAGIKNWNKMWSSLAQAERVVELLDEEHGVVDSRNARHAPRLQGQIEFRDVTFSYDPDKSLMDHVSVSFPANRVTAIVGPTGSGKTTLVSMVARLYDPEQGQVLIDGHDLREFTLESLRDQISVVLQESTLLYSSVAENISYGKTGADTAEIETAAWLAGAHDFIRGLPNGYNTEIGERGDTLSGGQRQLIAISRAIIRDAPIIILDEPMTGLDASSAAQVREALDRLMTNKTVLFITHNLAMVESADNVVVMNNGRVVQQGTPRQLRETEGLFRELFLAQAESEGMLAGTR